MPPLGIEVCSEHNQTWQHAGTMQPGDVYGSISDNTPNAREVYYFGINVPEATVEIKRCLPGYDIVNADTRTIHDIGNGTVVASLEPGQSHEITVRSDHSPAPRHIRFTHLAE